MYQVIIHGGANTLVHEDIERKQHCEVIVTSLEQMLQNGGSALDVCEAGVNALENDPLFNAGRGAYLQIDGKCRLDACIMDSELRLGAVIQLENIKNPISVARKLLETEMHSTLVADGALRFAQEMGFQQENIVTEKQMGVFLKNMNALHDQLSYKSLQELAAKERQEKLGTVGCVVRDREGRIAAGTSTGGLRTCYPHRVGDSPLVGCGNYANRFAGVSCTGVGEKIMRLTLARLVAFEVENGYILKEALQKAIKALGEIEGDGGIIAISYRGEIEYVHNTPVMSMAFRQGE